MADEHVVDVLHLEREMIEAGAFVPHAEERVMVDVIVAGVDPAELADDVVLVAGVDVVRADQAERLAEPADGLLVLRRAEHGVADPLHARRAGGEADDLAGAVQRLDTGVDRLAHDLDRLRGLDAVHDLDRVAVRFGQADALAAAGFVDVLDPRRAGELRDRLEVVLAADRPGEADESGIALLGDVDVVRRIGAAHIQRRRCSRRAHHAERGQEFFLQRRGPATGAGRTRGRAP